MKATQLSAKPYYEDLNASVDDSRRVHTRNCRLVEPASTSFHLPFDERIHQRTAHESLPRSSAYRSGAHEAIRKSVSKTISEDDPNPLLSPERATTASLFLNRNLTDPELIWYVELPRSVVAAWEDPEATVAEAFSFKHDALSDTDDIVERELLVHAVNPLRPRTDVSGGVASQGTTDSGGDRIVDVALVDVWFDFGVPERLADWFAGLARRFKAGELELGPIETWSTEMIDIGNIYTESLFFEQSANGYGLLIYMEADEMQQVYDAYYDTWNPVLVCRRSFSARRSETRARSLTSRSKPISNYSPMLSH